MGSLLWMTVGVLRCVRVKTMSMNSLFPGTTWIFLKLYNTMATVGGSHRMPTDGRCVSCTPARGQESETTIHNNHNGEQ